MVRLCRTAEGTGTTEAHDVHGTRIRLTQRGIEFRGRFVPLESIAAVRPGSQPLWNPATNLFELTVVRRGGPDVVLGDLTLQTAERLRRAILDALGGRRA